MSDTASPPNLDSLAEAVIAALDEPLYCETFPEDAAALAEPSIEAPLRAVAHPDMDRVSLDGAVGILRRGLELSDPYQAGRVAQTMGAVVEYGAAPGCCCDAVLDRLEAVLAAIVRAASARAADVRSETVDSAAGKADLLDTIPSDWAPQPETIGFDLYKKLRALAPFGLAAMAMLVRDSALARSAQTRERFVGLVADLDHLHQNLWYLHEVLGSAFGLEPIVLYPDERSGWRVRLDGVRNNFHFISLFEGTLIEAGELSHPEYTFHPDVLALARGETFDVPEVRPAAIWHYYTWGALVSGKLDWAKYTLWGEMRPQQTPQFDGTPVILMAPLPFQSRSWDPHFIFSVHPALRPSVEVVERLDSDAVDGWLERLRGEGGDDA